ncbi:threonine/homoserine/homoserine lactone efflux protein [Streptomyces sp. B1I3]|nr:threonine/homoserine/homoserine lactone efflux protein [Streptomyces sp. B1I3]
MGTVLGGYVLIVAAALGVGTIVERPVPVFTVLKPAGAATWCIWVSEFTSGRAFITGSRLIDSQ